MAKKKRKAKNRLRDINGTIVDTKTKFVQNGTVPISERHYYGSRIPKDIKCYDEKKGKYINVEMFSPVIYDLEHNPPK